MLKKDALSYALCVLLTLSVIYMDFAARLAGFNLDSISVAMAIVLNVSVLAGGRRQGNRTSQ